jgi:hypothetical protein
MVRPLMKINELVRVYNSCNNPEKEKLIQDAINNIQALMILPVGGSE